VQATGSRAEALSVNRAFKAIKRADVVCLVIEAMSGVVEQVKLSALTSPMSIDGY
jgi:predicted GTPase